MIEIEPLKELPAPPHKIPPCDIRFLSVSYVRLKDGTEFWTADHHRTRAAAEREAEYCIAGTLRIFEVPNAEFVDETKEEVCQH